MCLSHFACVFRSSPFASLLNVMSCVYRFRCILPSHVSYHGLLLLLLLFILKYFELGIRSSDPIATQNLAFKGFSLVSDCNYVLQNASRNGDRCKKIPPFRLVLVLFVPSKGAQNWKPGCSGHCLRLPCPTSSGVHRRNVWQYHQNGRVCWVKWTEISKWNVSQFPISVLYILTFCSKTQQESEIWVEHILELSVPNQRVMNCYVLSAGLTRPTFVWVASTLASLQFPGHNLL